MKERRNLAAQLAAAGFSRHRCMTKIHGPKERRKEGRSRKDGSFHFGGIQRRRNSFAGWSACRAGLGPCARAPEPTGSEDHQAEGE